MKFFQQLMLAPAALGLVAPLAAEANGLDLASSTQSINTYTQQQDLDRFRAWEAQNQVTSINQFADVQPTDWAYQALSNLIERYGCVAGYPNGTYKGGQAMTRFEAAALLNACLDRVTETTDELQRLINEFQKELAVLKGRVDGLDKRVGQLEATQFSTTTKLQGDAVFVLGANAFGGSQANPFTPGRGNNTAQPGTTANKANWGATVFNYDLRLNFLTSFTGKDLLYTRLRSGNFGDSPFGGRPYNLMALDRAFGSNTTENIVQLDRLYYRFPIGKEFTALVGPRARNTEFLAISPSFYRSEILDVFTLHGAPGTYNKATGAAAGIMWKQKAKKGKPFFAISTSYVAPNADNGNPNAGGIMTDRSQGSWTTQLGVQAPQWSTAFAWRYGQCGQNFRRGTQFANQTESCGPTNTGVATAAYSNNFALTAAWQPKQGGTIWPSVSLGWGYNALTQSNLVNSAAPQFNAAANIGASQSWQVGLQWKDAFAKGNAAGMAVGQPTFATSLRNGNTPQDGNYAWEWWYKFQVTDNIAITPAIFYLSRPAGQFTQPGQTNNVFGGLIQTQFRF
ncbi:MAG: iron uptake porin [Cyanobacteriota bacterium]|nr:iron uptake porin [Cyanobacteriota bacterium]